MANAAKKSLDQPDERVAAEGIAADVVQVGDDGSTLDIAPNDVFDIPPGHDGWVSFWRSTTASFATSWIGDLFGVEAAT